MYTIKLQRLDTTELLIYTSITLQEIIHGQMGYLHFEFSIGVLFVQWASSLAPLIASECCEVSQLS